MLTSLRIVLAAAVALALAGSPADAQFGKLKDKLKQKAEEKVDEKVDQGIDEALEGSEGDTTEAPAAEEEGGSAESAAAPAATTASEDMKLYTKYDFVPGDKVLFFDDLSTDEVGEFPSRWNLENGVFEVVQQGKDKYIMCSDEGKIRPRIAPAPLPPRYTVEMEFYTKGPGAKGHWFYIEWIDAEEQRIGELSIKDNANTALYLLTKQLASKALPASLGAGIHTMRIMATKSSIKCYLDHERIANVPAVEGFEPVGFAVHMDPWLDEADNPMLIRSFRFAEGGKTLRQQLDEAGRIVTHGILFDSGSTRIKAESYKTLADIGQLLADDAALRLSIEGHTDSDGADAANQALSDGRAAAVKTYLQEAYKIDGGRLETRGWGETKPIDTNDTPEGKANNRRVELVKL